ncbi:hypothetical protein Anapl_12113 [Anas platyrhynchos]|uniref:Uncharacterized protein n=1 Tax=Anas platyrhynchos TaxID=8839 RepID=R0JX76_ANAPL|nr:hypothetical protein Anapl_12113 [Anas platyrhynchos]
MAGAFIQQGMRMPGWGIHPAGNADASALFNRKSTDRGCSMTLRLGASQQPQTHAIYYYQDKLKCSNRRNVIEMSKEKEKKPEDTGFTSPSSPSQAPAYLELPKFPRATSQQNSLVSSKLTPNIHVPRLFARPLITLVSQNPNPTSLGQNDENEHIATDRNEGKAKWSHH